MSMVQKKIEKKPNGKAIVILHGWKLSGQRYETLSEKLELEGFQVFAPDLPGFGENTGNATSYQMEDYVTFLKEFLLKQKIKKCILVGHSFGGRVIVASISAWNKTPELLNRISGIVLTGAPLVRQELSLRKKVGIKISKLGKRGMSFIPFLGKNQDMLRSFVYRIVGERDYLTAGNMRNTFVNIIGYELESKLPSITIPTLLIWGKKDALVPFSLAKKVEKRIKTSRLVGIENGTHKLPYENPALFCQLIVEFANSL